MVSSVFVLLLSFLACSPLVKAEILAVPNDTEATRLLLQHQIGENLFAAYRSFVLANKLNESMLRHDGPSNNDQCWKDLTNIKNNPALLFQCTWYISFADIDAAGRPHSGISRGNFGWLGSYSQCLAISDAKYCVSQISISYPASNLSLKKVNWGACFPKSCNSIDIYFAVQTYVIQPVLKATGVNIEYPGSLCPEKPTYSTGVIATIAFFGVLLFLCLVGTVIDLIIEEKKKLKAARDLPPIHDHDDHGISEPQHSGLLADDCHALIQNGDSSIDMSSVGPGSTKLTRIFNMLILILTMTCRIWRDIFLCFSLIRNSQKIFNMNVPRVAITSINGIRVISITWVILGHLFLVFLISAFTDNKLGVIEDSQLFTIMPVINGYYSVDTFFFLSGLLVAYTCFRKMEKSNGKFNWFLFYFHRFWRLTPTYMAVILISVQLKRFFAEGPLWFSQYTDKLCEEHWWTNLLYINNFYPRTITNECVPVSWYLANDMQFFVITPPLLILMYKFRWRGMVGPGGIIAASTASIAATIAYWDLDPFSSLRMGQQQTPELAKKNDEWNTYVYIKPWCRAQPYFVGFVLGYYVFRASQQYYNRRRRPIVFWSVTLFGWAAATAVGMWLVYGPHEYIVKGADEWPLVWRVVYGMLERLLWGLVLAWVVYACHFGGAGLVGKFLSARFWIPFSRLTFNVYLLHFLVLFVMFVGAEGNIHYDFFNVAYYFVSTIVLSYAAAYILAVTVELPCNNLEDLALKALKDCSVSVDRRGLRKRNKKGRVKLEFSSDVSSSPFLWNQLTF